MLSDFLSTATIKKQTKAKEPEQKKERKKLKLASQAFEPCSAPNLDEFKFDNDADIN
jgi:hypothetical protein